MFGNCVFNIACHAMLNFESLTLCAEWERTGFGRFDEEIIKNTHTCTSTQSQRETTGGKSEAAHVRVVFVRNTHGKKRERD